MNPIEISAIIFCCIFGGALLGMWLSHALPERHLDAETKDMVKLGVGLVGTMAALLFGLLVTSAKSAYDAYSNELTQMAANTILLDRAFVHYGPAAAPIRAVLKIVIARMIDQVWGKEGTDDPDALLPASQPLGIVYDKVQELEPHTDAQHALQSQAESILVNLGQQRLLLFAQNQSSISTPYDYKIGLKRTKMPVVQGLSIQSERNFGLYIGLGIAAGKAFVGNIQSIDRLIWSATGDTSNLAARLQSLTRKLNAVVVIDAATQAGASDVVANFERRNTMPIRGRRQTADIYVLPLAPSYAAESSHETVHI